MLAHTQTHIYTNMKRNAFQCFLHISFTLPWKSVLSACGSIFQCWTTAPLPGVLQSLPDRLKHLLEFLWGFFLYINTVRHGKLPRRLFKYLLNLVEKYVENRKKKKNILTCAWPFPCETTLGFPILCHHVPHQVVKESQRAGAQAFTSWHRDMVGLMPGVITVIQRQRKWSAKSRLVGEEWKWVDS